MKDKKNRKADRLAQIQNIDGDTDDRNQLDIRKKDRQRRETNLEVKTVR